MKGNLFYLVHVFPDVPKQISENNNVMFLTRWLETMLMRILHPVKVYLNKSKQSFRSMDKKKSKLKDMLSVAEGRANSAEEDFEDEFEGARYT